MDLVAANSGKSRHDLAVFLTNYLVRTYPTQYWVVTVYDPVKGYQNHAFQYTDRVAWKLRHAGVNYVVTRYPRHSQRSPSVPISEVVGSVTGSNPETVLDSISGKFRARGLSWASIHVVKKKRSVGWWLDKRLPRYEIYLPTTISGKSFRML